MIISPTLKQNKRFWKKTKGSSLDKCLLWISSATIGGYGTFSFRRRRFLAHRFAYLAFYGNLRDDLDVLHSCDTPSCVNPYHLRMGTSKQNTKDSLDRGRFAIRERHGLAKLTQEKAREIRQRYAAGKATLRSLCREYNVSNVTIHQIIHNKIWREQ